MPRLVLGIVVVLLVLAPVLATHDPMATAPSDQLLPPRPQNLLGTDLLGRDVFSRVLYGGRHTLAVALLATILAVVPGVGLGILASVAGDWLDSAVMVTADVMLALPSLIIALAIVTILGTGTLSTAAAVGIAQIAPFIRVTRAAVRSARSELYVEAAYAVGASRLRVVIQHIIPNVRIPIAAFANVTFAYAILNSAAMSFLGLGGEPGAPDWGVMLWEGRGMFRVAPWIGLAPGIMISITVYALNALAIGLDKRLKR